MRPTNEEDEMTRDDANSDRNDEYPDDAGYPDGEGTLDEGTGAFQSGPTGDEAADDGGRDDTGAEGEAVVEELEEFDGPDSRDE
ncbi:hypothetical protein [Leifsonia shinshuensis]|uniref:hypothetical protein n=1 Tax=Leifsonia shinshuensis TaxID=150026 RepID=UPI0028580E05|nr:hypothetical protein [Leifsonia shinshuensis]MDR6970530.1 hypothetical protein [Leifsonia shinshuensis]